jgi:hypothetical protein
MTSLPDPKVLPLLKQNADFYASVIPDLEPAARDTLLSFLYFSSEAEYRALHPYYTPPRLIGGDTAFDVLAFSQAVPDLFATQTQIGDQFLEYSYSKRPKDLHAMISTCTTVLKRHNLPVVSELQRHVI